MGKQYIRGKDMKSIKVFQRGELYCVYNVLTMKKRYLTGQQYSAYDISDAEFDPSTLKPPAPELKVYQAVITTECNLRCKYCSLFQNELGQNTLRMTIETAKAMVDRYRSLIGEGLFIITGGEPLLNREVLEYLILHVNGTKVLFTNGTLLDKYILKTLNDNQVNIVFSLDGSEQIHNEMRTYPNGRGTYDQVVDAIKLTHANNINFGISLVAREHNIDHLEREIEYIFEEFNPSSLGINLPHYTEFSPFNIDPDMYADKLIDVFNISKKYKIYVDQINRRLAPLIEEKFRFRDCSAMGEKIVEFPDGTFSNCVNCKPVDKLPDKNVWAQRLPIFLPQCRDCWAIGICGGGCSFDGINLYGDGKIDERNCIITKRLLEFILWEFYDELKQEEPDPAELKKRYSHLLQRRGPGQLSISIGHDID